MSSLISVFNTSDEKEKFLEVYNLLMQTWTVPFEDKWIETSYGLTHVVVSGPKNGEPIVLLPGAQATCGMWGAMIPELTKKRRVFCLSLIDQVGLSKPGKVLENTQNSNEWLEETFIGLNLKSFDLGGNSLGSFIASKFALSHPETVKKLILTAPAATVSNVRFSYIMNHILASIIPGLSLKKRFLRKCSADLVDEKNILFRVLLQAMIGSKVISKIIPTSLTINELKNLKNPTKVILGEKDITSSKSSKRIVKDLSKLNLNMEIEILEDAGHLWTNHQYRSAGNKIIEFLD